MGIYLNPGSTLFEYDINSEIYVDKTGLIAYTNRVIATNKRYVCVSRPRRFGKSVAAHMLAAYYDKTADSAKLFAPFKIAKDSSFQKHAGKYDVLEINMQDFLSETNGVEELIAYLTKILIRDFKRAYPDIDFFDENNLSVSMKDIYGKTQNPFIIIIDEWDCIFREYRNDKEKQDKYLDFLRTWLKDKIYVGLAYMTGILPIKKYGTHSALNMFNEFSMENQGVLEEFVGFTKDEVKGLCEKYNVSYDECKSWYDGYSFKNVKEVHNPRSVVCAMDYKVFDTYWNKTETYEALKIYIDMNFDGLKESVLKLLAGGRQKIDTGTFQNDMTTLNCADDVMTLLIHLGYLGYDFDKREVFIPNREISREYVNALKGRDDFEIIIKAIKDSDDLLEDTLTMKSDKVAQGIEKAHQGVSHFQYNDENALSYAVSLAYFSAKRFYNVIREFPAGKGYADMVFLPRPKYADKPAVLIELKWDKGSEAAIKQIKEKNYAEALKDYSGKVLLVGISYDKKSRRHECKIEEMTM